MEGLMGHVTFLGLLRRETLSLFHSAWPVRSQVLPSTGTSRDQCTCRTRGFCENPDFDGVRLGERGFQAFSPVLRLSQVTEQHRVSGIPQMSQRWVEFGN